MTSSYKNRERTRHQWDGKVGNDGKRRTKIGDKRKVRQYPFAEAVMQITIPASAKVRETDTRGGNGGGTPYREFSVPITSHDGRTAFIKINCFLDNINPGDTLVATVKASQQSTTMVDSNGNPFQIYGLKLTDAKDAAPTHVVELVVDQEGVDEVMQSGSPVHDTDATDIAITESMSLFLDASLLNGNHCGGISVTPIE